MSRCYARSCGSRRFSSKSPAELLHRLRLGAAIRRRTTIVGGRSRKRQTAGIIRVVERSPPLSSSLRCPTDCLTLRTPSPVRAIFNHVVWFERGVRLSFSRPVGLPKSCRGCPVHGRAHRAQGRRERSRLPPPRRTRWRPKWQVHPNGATSIEFVYRIARLRAGCTSKRRHRASSVESGMIVAGASAGNVGLSLKGPLMDAPARSQPVVRAMD